MENEKLKVVVFTQQDLFFIGNRAQLGKYINELCHKYCLSFEMVLRRLCHLDGTVPSLV